jgi:hypothetical protein
LANDYDAVRRALDQLKPVSADHATPRQEG